MAWRAAARRGKGESAVSALAGEQVGGYSGKTSSGMARHGKHHYERDFMAQMFETKGEVAEWKMIYDEVKDLPVNEIITYERLDEILGRDFRQNRSPIDRVIVELVGRHRTLVNVRNVGYRIATAKEHAELARSHQRRSRRQIKKGMRRLESADQKQLTPDERREIENLKTRLSRLESAHRAMGRRQEQIEQRTERVEESNADLADKVESLTEKLKERGLI